MNVGDREHVIEQMNQSKGEGREMTPSSAAGRAPRASGSSVLAMLATGLLGLAAGFAVALTVATDAAVRSGFEDALAADHAGPRTRSVTTLGNDFDPSQLHLGRHVSSDSARVLPIDTRAGPVVGRDHGLPRLGERIVMSTAEGQFTSFEVLSIAPMSLAPVPTEGDQAPARASEGYAGGHVLVTLQSIDADGQPRRTLRVILEPPAVAGSSAAPIAPPPIKAL